MDHTTFSEHRTLRQGDGRRIDVRRFRLVVVECPEPPPTGLKRGYVWVSSSDTCTIGFHKSNDFELPEPSVSRFHCEIKIDSKGIHIQDLGSSNGTYVNGVQVESAFLRHENLIQLGRMLLRFELLDEMNPMIAPECVQFGSMVSSSWAMRNAFAKMERAAAHASHVLLIGETGTGKSTAAYEIHQRSSRAKGPFVEIDCGAIHPTLIESELFGHEKDAFTGAARMRKGLFEEAHGGTLFLDEIAELPLELQPKLLKAIEQREIRRIGSNHPIAVDVRIIAATHKDLKVEVNAKKFREDLYYRLAVLCISIPPLKERVEDIPMLVNSLLADLGAPPEIQNKLCSPALLTWLRSKDWPGNIRELRNHLEQSIAYEGLLSAEDVPMESGGFEADASRPYKDERERAMAAFERDYLLKLLSRYPGNISKAAEAAQVARVYLHRLLKKHGIRSE